MYVGLSFWAMFATSASCFNPSGQELRIGPRGRPNHGRVRVIAPPEKRGHNGVMPINALVLLRADLTLPEAAHSMRLEALDDCTLIHTSVPFETDADELVARLRDVFGDALDEHDDPRGLFVLPEVARPKARAYLDVLEEVGEGGQWVSFGGHETFAVPDGLGALSAVLGSMLEYMPESVLEAASAAATGNTAAFSQVSAQVASMMGHGPGDVSLAGLLKLGGDGRGLDLASPAFQQILSTLEQELEKDPSQAARLREGLFGVLAQDEDADES